MGLMRSTLPWSTWSRKYGEYGMVATGGLGARTFSSRYLTASRTTTTVRKPGRMKLRRSGFLPDPRPSGDGSTLKRFGSEPSAMAGERTGAGGRGADTRTSVRFSTVERTYVSSVGDRGQWCPRAQPQGRHGLDA